MNTETHRKRPFQAILSLLLTLGILLSSAAYAAESGTRYADGSWQGTGGGRNGDVTVQVDIEDGKITRVSEVSQVEDASYWAKAKGVFDTIVEQQSWQVDDVAGATMSSRGIRQAVSIALNKAAKAATENEPYSGGDGTEKSPYLISNAKQLATFAASVDGGETFAGQYVALTDDIDLSSVENWNPIGEEGKDAANLFQGSFDGRDHTISGLKIVGTYDAEVNLGLFSTLGTGAEVRGVNLTGVDITATGTDVVRAGAITGDLAKGAEQRPLVDRCSAVGQVSATATESKMAFAGGIAGRMQNNTAITNCWSDVTVSSVAGGNPSAYAAGIVGTTGNDTVILNCAAFGSSYASAPLNSNFGGMAGGISAMVAGKLWNTYATGAATIGSGGSAHNWVGALAGDITTSGMTNVDGAYVYPDTGAARTFGYYPSDAALTKEIWKNATTRESTEAVPPQGVGTGSITHDTVFTGTAMGRADMTGDSFAEILNGNLKSVHNLMTAYGLDNLTLNKWIDRDGRVIPAGGQWYDPTPDNTLFGGGTGTAEDPYLVLTADQMRAFSASLTDGVDYHGYCIRLGADIDLSGSDWSPVGGSEFAFDGTFDGAGHTISGVTIGSESVAKELGKDDVYIGLFGVLNYDAVVRNVSVTGLNINVHREASGDSLHVGGIAGAMQGATIDGCAVQGSITVVAQEKNTFAAGLVGYQMRGVIINSMSDTDLSCTVNKGDLAETGGLVGLNNRGLVANCYSLGNVYGSGSRKGDDEGMAVVSSLVAVNAGNLVNCYGAGSHTTGEYSYYAGAVSGWVTGIGKSYNCWYNGDAAMTIEGKLVNPVESIGTKVPAGVSEEGNVYTGGVVDKLTPYTAGSYTAIAEGLNASFPAFPIDITQYGLEANALRTWTVKDGVVTLSDTAAAVTYQQPEAELVPVIPQTMRDGTWYGRDESKQSVVAITVKNNQIDETKAVSGELSGDAYEAAVAKAQEKAVYGDTSDYAAMDPSRFAGGSGTVKDPYLISNEAQLRYLAEGLNEDVSFDGLYFRQTADIALKNGDWLPIGWGIMTEINNSGTQYCLYPFLGNYDGDGYAISGLTIGTAEQASADPRASYVAGLFGIVTGTHKSNDAFQKDQTAGESQEAERLTELRNIYLTDETINVSSRYQNYVAGLVGNAQNGFIIDNCHVSGTVSSFSSESHARAGGIAGNAIRGLITNCGTAAAVYGESDTGNAYVGGFFAMDNRVTTVNCYASGHVTATSGNNNKVHIGGFSGQAGGARYNCYASGDVVSKKTTTDVGGLNGRLAGIAVDNHCYFNTDARQEIAGTPMETKVASGVVVPESATANMTEGKSAAEMGSTAFVTLLNENRTNTAQGLAEMRTTVDACTMPYALHYTGDGSDLREWKLLNGAAGFEADRPTLEKQTITGAKARYQKTYGDKAFSLNAKATGKLSYKSSNTKVVKVSKIGTVTIKGAGTATITITAAATDTVQKATKTVKITVAKGKQTIKVPKTKVDKVMGDKAFSLGAKATGKLSYATGNKKVAVIQNGKVVIKGVGVAKITVKAAATGNVKAAKNVTVTVTVNPKGTALSSVMAAKKGKATVKWKSVKNVTGYDIQYGLKKSFKGAKKVSVKKAKSTSTQLKSLRKGKTYCVRIRTYQKVSGKTYVSSWSKAKTVKAK